MTHPDPVTGEDLNVLEDTLVTYREFIGKMMVLLDAFSNGSDGMRRRLETAYLLRPEKVIAAAQVLRDLVRGYNEFAEDMEAVKEDIEGVWHGEAATAFWSFYQRLTEHVSGEQGSLAAIAESTAAVMDGFGRALLTWQLSIAQAIMDAAAHDNAEQEEIHAAIASAVSIDPLQIAAGIAMILDRGIRAVHDSSEEEARFWLQEFASAMNVPTPGGAYLEPNLFDRGPDGVLFVPRME